MPRKCHLEEHSEEYIRFMNATEHARPRPKVHFPDLESLAGMNPVEVAMMEAIQNYIYAEAQPGD